MTGLGRDGRMVHGCPAVTVFATFEHRRTDNPQRFPFTHEVTVSRAVFRTDFDTQRVDGFVYDLGFVCAEENDVAVLRAGTFSGFLQDVFR